MENHLISPGGGERTSESNSCHRTEELLLLGRGGPGGGVFQVDLFLGSVHEAVRSSVEVWGRGLDRGPDLKREAVQQ